jgi:hypothetical protein
MTSPPIQPPANRGGFALAISVIVIGIGVIALLDAWLF